MKRLLITVAVLVGLLLALIQVFAMLGATSELERLARAAFSGAILLVMVIAYQRRKRPTDSDN